MSSVRRRGRCTPLVCSSSAFDCEHPGLADRRPALRTELTIDECNSTARVCKLGLRKLQPDDWLALVSVVWYTLLIVSLNQVFFSGGSNFMTAEEEAALTPYTTAQRVAGSKWVLVLEEMMVLTVWTCKLAMLTLYYRLTYVESASPLERWPEPPC